ncbi:DUF1003 domain-containing protein [Stenomitos frigidus]|uniref:DUF1003 domain-containing protein n=1 Tax=Stenomitos frigidus ULC18 TaxID=2107698 RepID=A0A2T1DY15_9CYAN|nr:DUF1003 domain-containing protein [Stenomitos frigidus]PSB25331.1 DUF1003 domain-containing protein [Stenomitos frigidus ULC18]
MRDTRISKHQPEDSRTSYRANKTIVPTAPLPDHIGQNIETIVALHAKAEQDVPRLQRRVEAVASFFSRPLFLFGILFVVAAWILANLLLQRAHLPTFDAPPFNLLELVLSCGSLLIATGVLIKQERQEKLAEQRTQLILQLNLISEQKIAKLVALLEELRRDLPNVQNRPDPEADVMQQAADPQVVMAALEETLAEELADLQPQARSEPAAD